MSLGLGLGEDPDVNAEGKAARERRMTGKAGSCVLCSAPSSATTCTTSTTLKHACLFIHMQRIILSTGTSGNHAFHTRQTDAYSRFSRCTTLNQTTALASLRGAKSSTQSEVRCISAA
jgi:hypothetical protein